jgi:hypothetical protein
LVAFTDFAVDFSAMRGLLSLDLKST